MLAITISLLVCHHLSMTSSTRLPLEVYELTPANVIAAQVAAAAAEASSTSPSQQQQQITIANNQITSNSNNNNNNYNILNNINNKQLEYTTVNADNAQQQHQQHEQQQHVDMHINMLAAEPATSTVTVNAVNVDNQLDRRRSRQMLDIIGQQQQQQQQQQQYQQQQQQHDALLKQHKVLSEKDVRILYQVGDSEADLPVCAPNAVCSKIDLYETPWIERQCRCPPTTAPNIIIHHHHQQQQPHQKDNLNVNAVKLTNHDKYRNYIEKDKQLQLAHKRLFVGDYSDKKFESLHLRKLMQKLGAVYAEDLHLPAGASDLLNHDDYLSNSADIVAPLEDFDLETLEHDYVQQQQQHSHSTAHMRHSGHVTHKPISFIGGCPSSLGIEDGHTIADKTRHYKLCQPIHKLPVCKHFRDFTWTLTTSAELNVTEQIVHCRCPKNSITYLTKREPVVDGSSGYKYQFACSPLTRIRCQRKQPCKLFTVRKRQEFLDEVNINALCQCPKGHRCPSHHTQSGVIAGERFLEDNIQTFSGYCMVND